MLSNLHKFTHINPQSSSVLGTVMPILQMRKLKLGGLNNLFSSFKTSEGLKGFEFEIRYLHKSHSNHLISFLKLIDFLISL